MYKQYEIKVNHELFFNDILSWLLNDKIDENKNVDFHIESDDYFGTLATVLDLYRQCDGKKYIIKEEDNLLKKLKNELLYLQKKYKIIKKDNNKKK